MVEGLDTVGWTVEGFVATGTVTVDSTVDSVVPVATVLALVGSVVSVAAEVATVDSPPAGSAVVLDAVAVGGVVADAVVADRVVVGGLVVGGLVVVDFVATDFAVGGIITVSIWARLSSGSIVVGLVVDRRAKGALLVELSLASGVSPASADAEISGAFPTPPLVAMLFEPDTIQMPKSENATNPPSRKTDTPIA